MSQRLAAGRLGHSCAEDAVAVEHMCACGDSTLYCCTACGQDIFVLARPGTWCSHAAEVAKT